MTNAIKVLQYDGHDIEFELSSDLMINATEMGKIFGRAPKDYTRLDRSKAFIAECLNWARLDEANPEKRAISPFIGVKAENQLVKKTQKKGTWMNRIVALDFASWLDPKFAVWMYIMVDRVLFNGTPATSTPFALPMNADERKLVVRSIQDDEDALEAIQTEQKRIETEKNAAPIRDRLAKNRKRLKALDREVVIQYELFISQQSSN